MKELLLFLFESSICLGIFLCVFYIFFRKTTLFKFVRVYFILGVLVSLTIPFISFNYDVAISTPLQQDINTAINISHGETFIDGTDFDFYRYILIVYVLGSYLVLFRSIRTIVAFVILLKNSTILKQKGYSIIENKKVKMIFSIFNFVILNPENIKPEEKALIMKHEIAHVKQKHWLDLVLCEILLLVLWFNPLAWIYVSFVKSNHEFLADEAVIKSEGAISDYVKILINHTLQFPIFTIGNSFKTQNHSKRLVMMKKLKTPSWRKAFVLAILPLFSIYIWAVSKPNYVFDQSKQHSIGSRDSILDNYLSNLAKEYSIDKDILLNCLLVIDKKEYPEMNITMLDPFYIDSLQILAPKQAELDYGSRGKNGVIYIALKKDFDYSALENKTTNAESMTYYLDDKQVLKSDLDKLVPASIQSYEIKEGNVVVVKTK